MWRIDVYYISAGGEVTKPFIDGTIEVSHIRSRRGVIVRDVCFFNRIGLKKRGWFWILKFIEKMMFEGLGWD